VRRPAEEGSPLYASAKYPEPDDDVIEAFVQDQPYAVVMAHGPAGHPTASLLPFVKVKDRITVHMVREDPTYRALAADPRGSVLVEEFLAFTPHSLVSERYAGEATLHFRAVLYAVTARLDDDPRHVAAALEELLARYEPQADHHPVADLAVYGGDLGRLGVADLTIVSRQAKFKLAQGKDAATRARLVEFLRGREGWRDGHAADAIERAGRR
jgi:predicted FMN-binding regulatory protein PaiB